MAGTASMQPERGQITYARSNFPHLIQLCASKEGPDHIVKNQSISSLDGLGQTDLVQKQAGMQSCFRPTLPSQSRLDANQIQYVYWVKWVELRG